MGTKSYNNKTIIIIIIIALFHRKVSTARHHLCRRSRKCCRDRIQCWGCSGIKYSVFYISYLPIVLIPSELCVMMSKNIRNIGICERANNSPLWLPPILLPFPLTQSSPFENCYYDIQPFDVIPHIYHFDFDIFGLSATWLLIWCHSIDLI